MIKQAVILAGGKGTRLGTLTKTTPKPVIPVAGKPFLSHLLWNLARHGVTEILLSTGYLHEVLNESLGDGSRFGVNLTYVQEESPLGTGGGLRNCLEELHDRFFVLNGDSIFDINYLDLINGETDVVLALRKVEDTARYGRVVHENGMVSSFLEKGESGPGAINGGVYLMSRDVVAALPEGASSLEKDWFPKLASEGKLSCRELNGFFIDIGIPEDLERAQTAIPKWRCKPALFLDRDGVINVNHGYVHKIDDLTWCNGAREAIKAANDRGWLVLVLTNQAGIGRGYYDHGAFHVFMDYMRAELAVLGAHIDGVYYCPHHPTEAVGEYLKQCDCRKPEPGMLKRAIEEWDINLEQSVLIGDSESDLIAGERAGVRRVFLFDPDTMSLADEVGKLCKATA
ncbi:D-glycero-beta-D-manno-heptose 1,7-bisphosphate 7-phosphatase [Desulfovibrio sp. JC022]|uniref:D-glycero-beta-D-manno-heptose 1,7-bisphosphate 7-phosphatase n=1 Tax=Desulfovibrio sp. JC022 TaxID=2593642 RepID=UPI0013D5A05F|nr:D-glycero-beta-D-manno-heptose 1,7-bisphosphate 7-phosphatase [Desulfovibrio sp. JC022]NDV24911.1 D-glycero-beta-D-manno-heptose 1,7-bisphosphate 7-phosphatase [Desulfovibrio sp. JC022]